MIDQLIDKTKDLQRQLKSFVKLLDTKVEIDFDTQPEALAAASEAEEAGYTVQRSGKKVTVDLRPQFEQLAGVDKWKKQ